MSRVRYPVRSGDLSKERLGGQAPSKCVNHRDIFQISNQIPGRIVDKMCATTQNHQHVARERNHNERVLRGHLLQDPRKVFHILIRS
jgi:hypothetical protein